MAENKVALELRKVEKKYKGRRTDTFEVIISDMARDAAEEIERLQEELDMSDAWIKRVAYCPCCNNCGYQKECLVKPKLGDIVAINCPLWSGDDYSSDEKKFLKWIEQAVGSELTNTQKTIGLGVLRNNRLGKLKGLRPSAVFFDEDATKDKED